MPDDYKDPALQTGPYPAWPTLPPTQQPQPRYLENDPTPWQGGDFPSHVSPWALLMALLGARAGKARSIMKDPGITGGGRPTLSDLVTPRGQALPPDIANSTFGLALQPSTKQANYPLPYRAGIPGVGIGMMMPHNDVEVLTPYERAVLDQIRKRTPPDEGDK